MTICINKDLIGEGKKLQHWTLGIGLSQLVGRAAREQASECNSELQSKAAWSLLGKGCLTTGYRQPLERLAAEIKYQQVVEANTPVLHCLFRAVYGVFLWDKERRLSIQLVSNYTAEAERSEIFLLEIHTRLKSASDPVWLMHSVREDKAHLLIVKDCFQQGIFSDILAI